MPGQGPGTNSTHQATQNTAFPPWNGAEKITSPKTFQLTTGQSRYRLFSLAGSYELRTGPLPLGPTRDDSLDARPYIRHTEHPTGHPRTDRN